MYELVFWRYREGIYLNHHLVYEALLDQQEVDGLEFLPVELILKRLHSVFSTWDKVDENSWKNPKGKGAFQVKTSPQSILIDCYGTQGVTMDLMADTLEEFKCCLYDPQVPVRYDQAAD